MLVFRYEILQCGNVEKLIKKRSGTDATDPPLDYVTIEDTFDNIKRAHIATGHGGVIAWLKKSTVNMPP